MEKKYQVFVSSTYKDLIEERKKVIDILLTTAKCIPVGMELFHAEDDEQFNIIKRIIDMCDFYVLIIGNRYGSINTKTDLSFTEMEYNYAVSQGIPVLVFILDTSTQKKSASEDDISFAKLTLFKQKAMKNRLVAIWTDTNSLGEKVAISIMNAIQENNRPGWVRGNPSGNSDIMLDETNGGNHMEKQSSMTKIPLPHNRIGKVGEEFFVKTMRSFAEKLHAFTIRSEEIIAEHAEIYKIHWQNATPDDKIRNLQVFLQQLCREVNKVFFNWGGVRTHFRYLHMEKGTDKGYYLKLAAAHDDDNWDYAMSKIPSTEGMIYAAAQFGEPLIYSLNSEWHYGPSLDQRDFKDYITFVLMDGAFKHRDKCLLSMGISFKEPDHHKYLYYLLNLCRFDNTIASILKSFEKAVNVDITETILKTRDIYSKNSTT